MKKDFQLPGAFRSLSDSWASCLLWCVACKSRLLIRYCDGLWWVVGECYVRKMMNFHCFSLKCISSRHKYVTHVVSVGAPSQDTTFSWYNLIAPDSDRLFFLRSEYRCFAFFSVRCPCSLLTLRHLYHFLQIILLILILLLLLTSSSTTTTIVMAMVIEIIIIMIMNSSAVDFINTHGRRISSVSGEDKESAFLFQRISITIQRFNSILLFESFPHDDHDQ